MCAQPIAFEGTVSLNYVEQRDHGVRSLQKILADGTLTVLSLH